MSRLHQSQIFRTKSLFSLFHMAKKEERLDLSHMPMQTIMKKKFSTDKAGDYRIVFSTFLLGNRVVCDIEIKKPYRNLCCTRSSLELSNNFMQRLEENKKSLKLTPVLYTASLYNLTKRSIACSRISKLGKCGKKSLPTKKHMKTQSSMARSKS